MWVKRGWVTSVASAPCLERWQGQIDTRYWAVEGHGVDEIRNAGIGSTRLEITI